MLIMLPYGRRARTVREYRQHNWFSFSPLLGPLMLPCRSLDFRELPEAPPEPSLCASEVLLMLLMRFSEGLQNHVKIRPYRWGSAFGAILKDERVPDALPPAPKEKRKSDHAPVLENKLGGDPCLKSSGVLQKLCGQASGWTRLPCSWGRGYGGRRPGSTGLPRPKNGKPSPACPKFRFCRGFCYPPLCRKSRAIERGGGRRGREGVGRRPRAA